ncbi:hypothetical protein [Lentilactobacillus otakiensis]
MDALKKLGELHDYVKKNYEQGKYDNPNHQDYSSREAYEYRSDPTDDYQMGFSQALKDHEENQSFKVYPEKLVNLGNKVSDNKMQELS